MKANAICIQCGTAKRHFLDQCRSCGLRPSSRADKGKSYVLSLYYKVGDDDRSLPWPELSAIGDKIKKGVHPQLSEQEIEEASQYVVAAEALGGWKVVRDVLWWLIPVFVAIGVLIFLLTRS